MGAQNVALVYLRWQHLPHRAFRALAYMALVSLDQPKDGQPARVYFAGPEPLARAIGRPGEGLSATDQRRVTEVITELRERGAISDSVRAGNGRRANYRLELEAPEAPATPGDGAELEAPEAPPQVAPFQRVGGASGACSGGASGASQGTTEGTRGVQEEQPSPGSPPHLAVVAENPNPIDPPDEKRRQHAALAEWTRNHPEAS